MQQEFTHGIKLEFPPVCFFTPKPLPCLANHPIPTRKKNNHGRSIPESCTEASVTEKSKDRQRQPEKAAGSGRQSETGGREKEVRQGRYRQRSPLDSWAKARKIRGGRSAHFHPPSKIDADRFIAALARHVAAELVTADGKFSITRGCRSRSRIEAEATKLF
jgi:hypothetical protein